jgi:hypothetical protein
MDWKQEAIGGLYLLGRVAQVALSLFAVSFGVIPFVGNANVLTAILALMVTLVLLGSVGVVQLLVINPLRRAGDDAE